MNREKKFRKLWKHIEYGTTQWKFYEIEEAVSGYYSDGLENWGLESASPMQQYTGLKDKNGKEIYEGDILLIKMGDAERKCEVVFRSGGFIIESDGFFGTEEYDTALIGYAIEEIDSVEVIGNIHQNPDLL